MGNIIAISTLALKVYTAYKDAPDGYSNISEEVMTLQMIVYTVAQYFEGTALSDNEWKLGLEVLKSCHGVLKDLDSLIAKYNANTHQVFSEVRLGAEDVVTLRARLILNTGLLNGFIQRFDIPPSTLQYLCMILTSTSDVTCVRCKYG